MTALINRSIRILGIGTDIVKIARFTNNSENERFLKRAFHTDEINRFNDLKRTVSDQSALQYLAGRWAAKESVYKAFGGRDRARLNFQNIRIMTNERGTPYVDLVGNTRELANELDVSTIHLSISHDTDYAVANAIIEHYYNQSQDTTKQ
ncbi:hypothetical protein SAMD00019534_117570 [Acytostelium subglobosum LB1]|uniref:hypothetical protein n=1 Tax=Acytostelium subglobosum LB1 TaxID=1410327 RepID=UPI000644BBCD|nr:hypothetical protein SAMD00019534_117570 [Acytostelium subglobosum LB1]GAM28581.1 hypothetical protein SAMD00019534_117570 [Acytostelium subglobosum LB1]|eukprot:XP_012748359.1 hypothetical protein SAMD00019534_117570 [Acytostelium subglobosum LB1]